MKQITPTSSPSANPARPGIDKRKLFAGHFLLRHLTPSEADKLAPYARLETHRANTVIFEKGHPGHGMMAVVRGRVKIRSPSPGGKEVVLNVIEPGDVFGEISLLDGKERSADAVAMQETELLVLERRDFLPFLEAHPEISVRLLTMLCERLRRTSEKMEDVLFLSLPARLAKTLLQMAATSGKEMAAGTRIGLRLSQQELGNMVATTRESINKQLRQWQKKEIISIDKGFITIRNRPALELLVESADEEE